ncbi:MAG: hypothetical protein F6K27_16840 [Okeania sp. SIO2F5]|nr:hypothetical protein [Okeania sp. SIO2G5]NEP94531.1 hypothetical protein [Okeania sp. SIO2F5]
MGRWVEWVVEKTVSRKETEIHPLSWSIGYGEETRRVTELLRFTFCRAKRHPSTAFF